VLREYNDLIDEVDASGSIFKAGFADEVYIRVSEDISRLIRYIRNTRL
jgi:hypothetical protein